MHFIILLLIVVLFYLIISTVLSTTFAVILDVFFIFVLVNLFVSFITNNSITFSSDFNLLKDSLYRSFIFIVNRITFLFGLINSYLKGGLFDLKAQRNVLNQSTKVPELFIKSLEQDKELTHILANCRFETIIHKGLYYVFSYSIVINNFVIYTGIINLCSLKEIKKESDSLVSNFLKDCVALNKDIPSIKFVFNDGSGSVYSLNNSSSSLVFLLNYSLNYLDKAPKVFIKDTFLEKKESSEGSADLWKLVVFFNSSEIVFQDSSLFFGFSLKHLVHASNKKFISLDKENFAKYLECDLFRQEFLYSCVNNCKVLNEICSDFRELVFNIFNIDCLLFPDIPSLAVAIFKSNFCSSDIENTGFDMDKDSFLRKVFVEGSFEQYKPFLDHGFLYDINSMGPSVMAKYDYPVGVGEWLDGEHIDLNTFFGFVETEVECPLMEKPLLYHVNENGVCIAGYGHWRGVYFSEELIQAEKLGYKFNFIKGLKYKRGNPFKDYVEKIYALRLENPSRTSFLNIICKKLLNSLILELSEKNEEIISVLLKEEDCFLHGSRNFGGIGDSHMLATCTPQQLESLKSKSNILSETTFVKEHSAFQLHAAVASYIRLEIYKYKTMENLNVVYSDTDSIFCQNQLDSAFVSENKLGFMRLKSRFKNGIFVEPFLYYYEPENICPQGRGANLVKEDFFSLLEKKTTEINSFTRSRKSPKLFIMNYLSYSREKVLDNKKRWVNTKPIFINQLSKKEKT